jgi:hypothetical protein
MTVRLNQLSYDYAEKLIKSRQCVLDARDKWSEHRPSRTLERKLFEQHPAGYRGWHLGEDDEEEANKSRYRFPMAILREGIGARSCPRKRALASINIWILRWRARICTG